MKDFNYYEALGLSSTTCSMGDIRKAYYSKAKEYHPDKLRSSSSLSPLNIQYYNYMMKKINEAKNILLNEESRREYNQLKGFPLIWDCSREKEIENKFYEDRNTDTFKKYAEESPPIILHKEISFAEWCDPKFILSLDYCYHRTDICNFCEGYGWSSEKKGPIDYNDITKLCTLCFGKGYLLEEYDIDHKREKKRKRNEKSNFIEDVLPTTSSVSTCKKCLGMGRIPIEQKLEKICCKKCRGEGLIRKKVNLKAFVNPPAHINSKTATCVLCIKGGGNRFNRSTKNGDLHIIVTVNGGSCNFSIPTKITSREPEPPEDQKVPYDSIYECGIYINKRKTSGYDHYTPNKENEDYREYEEEREEDEEKKLYHSCEESLCYLGGLCTRLCKTEFPFNIMLKDGTRQSESMEYLLLSPHENGIDMMAKLPVPFNISLIGLNLQFPLNLYLAENQDLLNASDTLINVCRAYPSWRNREIPWSGDKWILKGWGAPRCSCNSCGHPTFINDCEKIMKNIALNCRYISNYIPSYAPFYILDLEKGTQKCMFSFYKERLGDGANLSENKEIPSHGDLIFEIEIKRPCDFSLRKQSLKEDKNFIYKVVSFFNEREQSNYKTDEENRIYTTSSI